jgi:protein-S-isoprenylcysteine O-methyltransferase Ste14
MLATVRSTMTTASVLGLVLLVLPCQLLRLDKLIGMSFSTLMMAGGGLFFLVGAGVAFSGAYYLVRRGEGTPWSCTPPCRMVVAGPYAHIQHPIWVGLLCMVCGEALWVRSTALALYAVVLIVLANLYVATVEEPGLEKRFGADYRAYRAAVPRWVPFRRRRIPSSH